MDTMQQVYMDAAKACGLKDGDTVRVTRAAISHEAGWYNIWASDMDNCVGCIGTVRDCNPGDVAGIAVVFPGGALHVFPYFVLEKVEDDPVRKFKVGDYVRVLRGWDCGARGVALPSPGKEALRMTIGKVGRIKRVGKDIYGVEFSAPINDWWGYPWFVLEKAEPEFKPFDKVLVRDSDATCWKADFFSHMRHGGNLRYGCVGGAWRQCIPYEGNERLLGTVEAPND